MAYAVGVLMVAAGVFLAVDVGWALVAAGVGLIVGAVFMYDVSEPSDAVVTRMSEEDSW